MSGQMEGSCPLARCNWRWDAAFAGKGRTDQLAIAGHAAESSIKVLVRPEKIRVVDANSQPMSTVRHNVCSGIIEQTSFVGGMTRVGVRCRQGTLLRIKMASSRASDCLPAGGPVPLCWAANDSVVLKG